MTAVTKSDTHVCFKSHPMDLLSTEASGPEIVGAVFLQASRTS